MILLEQPLMLGKIEGRRRRGRQGRGRLDGVMDSKDMSLSKLWETVLTEEPGVLRSRTRATQQHYCIFV